MSMEEINSVVKLLEVIDKRGAIIYGIGYVSKRFIESIKQHGLAERIICCVTTNYVCETFEGYDVIRISDLKHRYERQMICIATHGAVKDEIMYILKSYGYIDYVWIYPFQHELRFGKPKEVAKSINIEKILEKMKDDYRLAVRLLAIDQYYEKNDCGYDIYIKAQCLHCELNTAQKRLDKFIELIKSWEVQGFDNRYRPEITDEYEIIDGVHRIALAVYHGIKNIQCDVYHSDKGKEYRSDEVDITQDSISRAGLTNYELEKVRDKAKSY